MNISPQLVASGRSVIDAVSTQVRDLLEARGQRIELDRGELLFRQGDPGDAFYLVLSGRLRVMRSRAGLPPLIFGDAVRGQVVGELAVITGSSRAATVEAARQSVLLEISKADFDQIITSHPEIMRPLLRQVAEILSDTPSISVRNFAPRVIALAPAHADAAVDAVIESLARSLESYTSVTVVAAEPRDTLMQRLEAEETHGARLLLQLDEADQSALLLADRLLLIADDAAPLADTAASVDTNGPVRELVRIMAEDALLPRAGRNWLDKTRCETVHYLRGVDDTGRLARELCGKAVGMVLGGGGACAFAHIGALRAWRERGLPIDHVAGASFGAIIGAQAAAGWTPEHMLDENRRIWNGNRIDREFTLPRTAVLGSTRQLDNLETMFPGIDIEDLWLPFACVTANLSRCRLEVQRQGAVSHWVHAGASPPALQPPVADNVGELHVDGGVLDNLPVRAMREAGTGCVVAVNVSPMDELRVDPGLDGHRPGWWSRLSGRADPRLPNLVSVLYRTATLTSLGAEAESESLADLVIHPELSGFGLTDYGAIETLERLGYEATLSALDHWQAPPWLDTQT